MAIYKIKAVKIVTIGSYIVVEANSLNEALDYAKNNDEWHEGSEFDDEDWLLSEEFKVLSGHKITNQLDMPKSRHINSLPWNGDGDHDCQDILKSGDIPNK